MNIQDWSPLGWTGWISLQSKGLSKVLGPCHPVAKVNVVDTLFLDPDALNMSPYPFSLILDFISFWIF